MCIRDSVNNEDDDDDDDDDNNNNDDEEDDEQQFGLYFNSIKYNYDESQFLFTQNNKDIYKHLKTISLLNPKKELEQIYLVLSHLMGKRVSENHIGPKNIFTKDSLKNATVLKINLNFQSDNNTDYNLERHDQEENVSNNDSGCSKLYFDDESKTKNDTSFSKKRIKKNLVTGKQKKLIFENKLVSPVYLKQFLDVYKRQV